MDPDVSDAIDSLRFEFRELGASVNVRFETLEERMNARFARVDARFDSLEGRFDSLEGRFDSLEGRFDLLEGRFGSLEGRFEALEASVTARIDASAADTRRYFDIVIESLRDDIRIIAEGLVALNAKVDARR
jgi:predicted nuclease with TOPRIM domain